MKYIKRKPGILPEYDLRSICPVEKMLLFDIESTGLKKETTQLYLVGCAFFEDDEWNIVQWLTSNASDEETVLGEFLEFASGFDVLVTFNGEGFDIPYIKYKAEYYGIKTDFGSKISLDIYKRAKRARKFLKMSSMSQKSTELFLGIDRDDLMDGGRLIPVYFDYERSGDVDKERLLLLHNYDDLQGMLKILPVMAYTDCLEGGFDFRKAEEVQGFFVMEFVMNRPVPVSREFQFGLTGENETVCISMDGKLLQISISIHSGIGKLPLNDIENYYYLPDEDRVIHKDVAQFIPGSRRRKATRQNCHIKKAGKFLPGFNYTGLPAFIIDGDRKRTYMDYDSFVSAAVKKDYIGYAYDILSSVTCC
ncbi:MAG: ribonuclease H-like domain-containing protein [Parasporobacterium sp.]|nr:ribonuclease H-like domain-containing protein [Parasporobacterium sp.]